MATDTEIVMVRVNDVEGLFPRATTLAVIVGQWTAISSGCAAAINGAVVPRALWASREVENGDRVEIVSAQPGG
ncbi:MAG: sulfur carrier protein ThiS [Acidimicrobiales bacterium]